MFTELTVTPLFVFERVLDLQGPKIHLNVFEVTNTRFNIIRAHFVYQIAFTQGNVNGDSLQLLRQLAAAPRLEEWAHRMQAMHHHNVYRDFIDPGSASQCIVPMAEALPAPKRKRITRKQKAIAHAET